MSLRTTTLAFVAVDGSGTALAGQVVTFTLTPPTVGAVLRGTDGSLIDTTPIAATADGSGNVSESVIANGDITPSGSTWTVAYLSTKLISSFDYSGSPIDPGDWAVAGQTVGLLKMTLTDLFGDASAVVGRVFQFKLASPATWTGGIGVGQLITALGFVQRATASDGTTYVYLIRQSELNPDTGYYIAQEVGGQGAVEYFTVPTAYTGDAGVWAIGTTYAEGDVVRISGTDVPYISQVGSNVGNDPTTDDGTHWLEYAGEPISAYLTAPTTPDDPRISAPSLLTPLQTYSPVLQGATDNPTVTYTHQIGRYYLVGKLCFLTVTIVTSTMTKTTTSDTLRVSLPVAAANVSSAIQQMTARVENATAVKVADLAETTPNASYLQFREVSTGSGSALMTYGVTDIGVLTNTITIVVTGVYETS